MAAGFIYSAAPTGGVGCIIADRALLGAMSAQSVATQAFVSTNTSLADRTRYMSVNTLVRRPPARPCRARSRALTIVTTRAR